MVEGAHRWPEIKRSTCENAVEKVSLKLRILCIKRSEVVDIVRE